MNCARCGAPLVDLTQRCAYCDGVSDTDLRRLYNAHVTRDAVSDRICPRCNVALETIRIDLERTFQIERCLQCLGTWFDPDELEALVHAAVGDPDHVDLTRINVLVEEGGCDDWPLTYIPCPVCRTPMLRKAYGVRSGVLVDWCKPHGTWLDAGELGRLLTWARAGGLRKTAEAQAARAVEEHNRAAFTRVIEPPDMQATPAPQESTLLRILWRLLQG